MITENLKTSFLNAWFEPLEYVGSSVYLTTNNFSLVNNNSTEFINDRKIKNTNLYGVQSVFLDAKHEKKFVFSYNSRLGDTNVETVKPIAVSTNVKYLYRIPVLYPILHNSIRNINLFIVEDSKKNLYYIGRGAIFDSNLKPIFITGVTYTRDSDKRVISAQREVILSPEVFNNIDRTIEKYLVKNILPFLASCTNLGGLESVPETSRYTTVNDDGTLEVVTRNIECKSNIKITINTMCNILDTTTPPNMNTTDKDIREFADEDFIQHFSVLKV